MGYIEKLLSSGEKILLRQKQHWAAIIGLFVSLLFQILFLWVLIQILDIHRPPSGLMLRLERFYPVRYYIEKTIVHLPKGLLMGLLIFYLAKMALSLLVGLVRWLNSEQIVTNRRVMHVSGILSKTVIDSSVEKINDVLLRQSLIGRILGYGQISIMTASEIGLNAMSYLKRPVEFKRVLMDAKRALGSEGSMETSRASKNVKERLADLEELKLKGLISREEYEMKRKSLLSEI